MKAKKIAAIIHPSQCKICFISMKAAIYTHYNNKSHTYLVNKAIQSNIVQK